MTRTCFFKRWAIRYLHFYITWITFVSFCFPFSEYKTYKNTHICPFYWLSSYRQSP